MKAEPRKRLGTAVNVATSRTLILECLILSERFSSAQGLLRVTAYVLHFIHNAKAGKLRQERRLGVISTEGVGIMRCKGRLMKSDLPYDTKCPALIPPSHLTSLIIRGCHERVVHNGVTETLAELRTRYWLARGRHIVKTEISSCNKCWRLEGLHPPRLSCPNSDLKTNIPSRMLVLTSWDPCMLRVQQLPSL